jgi:hypothetical protein
VPRLICDLFETFVTLVIPRLDSEDLTWDYENLINRADQDIGAAADAVLSDIAAN